MTNFNVKGVSAAALDTSRRTPIISADLSGAYLGDCVLKGVNLAGANLSGVDLVESDLTDANLSGANLSGAVLRWANLTGTNLTGTNLTDADLSGTNLAGADLTGAVGISSKEEEIAECERILAILKSGKGSVNMAHWHTCDTVHCLAGWVCPGEPCPAAIASRKIPSLAWLFYENEMPQDRVIREMEKVISGHQVTR